jgi:hypothetical protein
MKQVHQFNIREMKEIKLALFYAKHCDHGTAGHNRLMLIAKMATALNIQYYFETEEWVLPESVIVLDDKGEFVKEMP